MRLISEIEQNLVGGGDYDPYAAAANSNGPGGNGWEGSGAMDAMSGEGMQTVEIIGNREAVDQKDANATTACHVISGGLGLTAGILLSESGPFAVMAAGYVVNKIDSACVDYVRNQK